MTHEGTKCPRGECLSISHIPTGGVTIDLFLIIAKFSLGKPGYSKVHLDLWQMILHTANWLLTTYAYL